jgi:uncharacterized protein
MTPVDLSLAFVLGLVSSLHCLQMCGPIVLSYSLPMAHQGAGRRQMLWAHAAYNGGRLTTYMLLGALAGALGGAAGLVGEMAGFANAGRILAGVAMAGAGVVMLGFARTGGLVQIERPGLLRSFSRMIGGLITTPTARSKFRLGLLLGFLPCGLIYGALLKAVDTGALVPGALTMLAFGLGTAIALIGMGLVSGLLGGRIGRWSNRLAAASLILIGVFLVYRGFTTPSCHALR